jgi:hypothetical protein
LSTTIFYEPLYRTRSNVVATNRKVVVSIPDEVTGFFNLPNSSSGNMALQSTQPLAEMGTRNLSEEKGQPEKKAKNLAAICEPIV